MLKQVYCISHNYFSDYTKDLVVQSGTEAEDNVNKQLNINFYVKFNSVVTSDPNITTITTYVINVNALQGEYKHKVC